MKMEESQLIAAIEAQEANAETYGNLQEDRVDALDYYLGKPMGNEVPGRSQVIARQVWDTVEWLKPQVTDIFCSGEKVVAFSPKGPNDVKAADQESDYVNHVITQRNEWFEIFYSWCHDALIQKNGYVKVYWDDSIDLSVERYKDLTNDEYALLMQDKDVEVTEHQEVIEVTIDQMGIEAPVVTHSVTLQRKLPRNVVKIDNIAPEHVRVSQNARSLRLQDSRVNFVQHAEFQTISQLRQDGFDVADDIADGGDGVGDWEEDLRDDYTPLRDREGEESDPSMRRVKVRESWIRVDYDGDGLAELRHVICVGTTVLHNEECDVCPIVALCPTPLPHQHYGLSVADAVMDLQKIQTALLRGALDNQYLANNGRYAISEDVNLDDMLDSRPGGIVRVANGAQPGNSIFPLTHPTAGAQVVPMMEYVDKIAERRTGVSEQSMGLNPESMNNQAGAVANAAMLTAAQQRIRFIARVFAETGVKSLFQLVHMLTLKHSRQQELIELRGEWVPIDPRTWVKRNDLQVSLSLGSGDKAQQLMFLQQIAMAQKEALAIGVATPQNIYNTLTRMVKAGGYKDAAEFWTDPRNAPAKAPPPPDPRIVVEQMRQQADIQRFQAEQQTAQVIEGIKAQAKQRETELTLELQAANDARDSEREQLKAQLNAQLEQVKIESNERIAMLEDQTKRYVAELQANVDLQIAGMKQPSNYVMPSGNNVGQFAP